MSEVSQRARELLAAELEADNLLHIARNVRGEIPEHLTRADRAALRAIDKAIAEERAAIVKWLGWQVPAAKTEDELADAIERGDHLRGEHHEG